MVTIGKDGNIYLQYQDLTSHFLVKSSNLY